LFTEEEKEELKINTDKFVHYFPIYDFYFKDIKDKEINILEIGVKNGESLRLWSKYFKNANIIGVDLNPECLKEKDKLLNIDILIGDQSDPKTFEKIKNTKFDIVIDDGSHVFNHMIMSYLILWKNLKPGGLYFIEDTSMTFHNNFLGYPQNRDEWDGFIIRGIRSLDLDIFSYNIVDERIKNKPNNRANYDHPISKNIKKNTGIDSREFKNEILFMHVYNNLLVYKKKFDLDKTCWNQLDSSDKILKE